METIDNNTGQPVADQGVIEKFKAKFDEFLRVLNSLKNKSSEVKKYPSLQADYKKLLDRGESIRKQAQRVYNAAVSAVEWVSDLFSFDGLHADQNTLGALPLIPIAVIGGVLALMVGWVKDVYVFNKKLDEMKRLEAKGMSAAEAAKIVDKISTPNGLNLNLPPSLKWLVLGGLGLVAYNAYKRK